MGNAVVSDTSPQWVLRWGEVDFSAAGDVPTGFSQVALNVGASPATEPDRHNEIVAGAFVALGGGDQATADSEFAALPGGSGVVAQNLPRFATEDGALEDSGTPGTFVETSAGAGDAGKPAVLDSSGKFDSSLLGTPALHASTHEDGQSDAITGAALETTITPAPTNYTPTANTIKGQFDGVDSALGDLLKLDGTRPMAANLQMGANDIEGGFTPGGTLTAAQVALFTFLDEVGSVGFFGDPLSPALITPNASDFDVATGIGAFRTTADIDGDLGIGDWPAALANAIPLNSVRYVGVEWNSGTPQVVIKTTNVWTLIQEWPIGKVTRDNDGVHETISPIRLSSFAALSQFRISETDPFARVNGLRLGTSGLTVQRTAGRAWLTTTPIDYSLFDSNASDTFDRYFGNAAQGFDDQLNETSWEDQSFYAGTAGPVLSALGNNRFGVRWFYMDFQTGNLSMMYGTSNTNDVAVALLEEPPTDLPPRLLVGNFLLGRVVMQESNTTAIDVADVFGTDFSSGGGGDGDVTGPTGGVVADEVTVYADTGGKAIAGSGGLLSANLAVLDGTRAYTGNMDLGSNAITNVGTVDGVTVSAHASRHANGGADELSVAGLSGLLADDQNPTAHAGDHSLAGSDQVTIENLHTATTATTQALFAAGANAAAFRVLAAGDLPAHVSTHANGGSDELNVAGLSGLLADEQNPTAHAGDHILGGGDEIDGDQLDIDFTPTNYTPDTTPSEATNVDHLTAHLAGIDNALTGGGGSLPVLSFKASKLETPLTADWAVNDFAPLAQDTLNSGTNVLLFDDTIEEGGGMTIDVPATAANMQLFTRARAEGVPAGAVVAKLLFYEREYPDGAAQGAWSSSQALTDVDLPITTQFFHVDVTNQTLAAWGLVAGSRHQIQITRTATGDTLVGDLALESIRLEFTA